MALDVRRVRRRMSTKSGGRDRNKGGPMSAGLQGARGFVVIVLLGLTACSGTPQRESPPPGEVAAPASGAPQIERSQPDVKPGSEGAFAAATRPKATDDEYMAAIAVLEVAS